MTSLLIANASLLHPETGAHADLLVIGGNPAQDVGVLTEPGRYLRYIIKEGRLI